MTAASSELFALRIYEDLIKDIEQYFCTVSECAILSIHYPICCRRAHSAKYCLDFIVGKKLVSVYENTCFTWSRNRNDVIQHISLVVLASWTQIKGRT